MDFSFDAVFYKPNIFYRPSTWPSIGPVFGSEFIIFVRAKFVHVFQFFKIAEKRQQSFNVRMMAQSEILTTDYFFYKIITLLYDVYQYYVFHVYFTLTILLLVKEI